MDIVSQIFEFNEKVLKIKRDGIELLSDSELNYAGKAIMEELDEFVEAHKNKDVIGAIDGALDLIYFSVGFLKRMGLSEQQVRDCMTAVHNANMEKMAGTQAKRGGEGVVDAIKPGDWKGPEERIAEVLDGDNT